MRLKASAEAMRIRLPYSQQKEGTEISHKHRLEAPLFRAGRKAVSSPPKPLYH